MNKMKLRNQVLLVNAGILAGLAFEYFQAAPILAIFITGIALLCLANLIFLIRWQRRRRIP